MATEEPGGGGEADLNAASEGLAANLSPGSGDTSLEDISLPALVADSEVRNGDADTAPISAKCVPCV